MMRQMRENTKWIMLVTALAFGALMVFEWGMDASGMSGGGAGSIGRVNGTQVQYDQYQSTYRNLYDQIQASQEEPVTSQQNRDVEEAAWDEVVNQILVQQELERRGIRVTDEEVRQAAQFSPPPVFRDNPAFQTDGLFDLQRYQEFLATADEQLLLQLEAYYRDVIPRGKLLRQVSAGVYVPDSELWQAWRDRNERVAIRYVSLDPATTVPDEDVGVSEAEIEDYYDDNLEDYEVPARASVKVVVLEKSATAADSAAARERAEEVRQEILGGADFAEVAQRESSDVSTAEAGGDLGTFARNAMVPAFDSAVWATPLNRIEEPVRTQFGWHLIEVTARWPDSATARHILIPIERTDASELRLLTLADSLEALGEDRPLEEAAAALTLEVQTVDLSEDLPFVAQAGQIGEGMDWALEEALPGDVSPVFETRTAYYALELIETRPEGHIPLEQAKDGIAQQLRLRKKLGLAVQRAERAVEGSASLDDVANGLGREIEAPETPFSRTDFVPGLGRQNAAIGAAFGTAEGMLSGVVSTADNAFVIEVVERIPADSSAWEAQKEDQRLALQAQIGQNRLQEWLAALRDNARIVDRRDEVLQSPDDAAPLPTGPFGF